MNGWGTPAVLSPLDGQPVCSIHSRRARESVGAEDFSQEGFNEGGWFVAFGSLWYACYTNVAPPRPVFKVIHL